MPCELVRCITEVYPNPSALIPLANLIAARLLRVSQICWKPYIIQGFVAIWLEFGRDTIFRGTIVPIYAYRCTNCGFQKDVLQKLSDAALTECPSCHAAAFKKQVTAAGFQLKGSGWYATDFRNPPEKAKPPASGAPESKGETAESKPNAQAPAKAGDAPTAAPTSPDKSASTKTDAPAAPASNSGSGAT